MVGELKIFAFVNPIKPYVKEILQNWRSMDEPSCDRLNELVEIRYRSKGYQVVWLPFSKQGNRREVDESLLSTRIVFASQDLIIPVGVPYGEKATWRWPKNRFACEQLPDGIEELKVGGFHCYSCASRFAKYCYRQGIPTLVDEDLTDIHFYTLCTLGFVPDERVFTAEGFGHQDQLEDPKWGKDFVRARLSMPWFPQPIGAY